MAKKHEPDDRCGDSWVDSPRVQLAIRVLAADMAGRYVTKDKGSESRMADLTGFAGFVLRECIIYKARET